MRPVASSTKGANACPNSTSATLNSAVALLSLKAKVFSTFWKATSVSPVAFANASKIRVFSSRLAPVMSKAPAKARMLGKTSANASSFSSARSRNLIRTERSPRSRAWSANSP